MKSLIVGVVALALFLVSVPALACDGTCNNNDTIGFQNIASLRPTLIASSQIERAQPVRSVARSNISTRGITTGKLVRQVLIADDGTVSYKMVPEERTMASSGSFRPNIRVVRRPASIERGPAFLKSREATRRPVTQGGTVDIILE